MTEPSILLRYGNESVELGVVFYLKSPSHVSIPKNQNDTLAKDALFMEKFISAECVRNIARLCELF